MKYSLIVILSTILNLIIHPITVAEETRLFQLLDTGKEEVVDYYRYGQFTGIGTHNYRYDIKKPMDLANAVGEGIYPIIGYIKTHIIKTY